MGRDARSQRPHLVGAQHRGEGTELGPGFSAKLRAHGVPCVHQEHGHLHRGQGRGEMSQGVRPASLLHALLGPCALSTPSSCPCPQSFLPPSPSPLL